MMPDEERLKQGPVAIFECLQEIPCDPCADACQFGAVLAFQDINDLPQLDYDACNGCGNCVSRCPGLAIFVIDMTWSEDKALLKLPYELLPLPQKGDEVRCFDREGTEVGQGRIVRVVQSLRVGTPVLWVELDKELALDVRHVAPLSGGGERDG